MAERRRRVFLLITSSGFGGAETLIYQIACRLHCEGRHEILVCSIKPKGAVAFMLEDKGVRVESLDMLARKEWKTPWKIFMKTLKLIRLLRAFQPDILHASLFQADVLAAVCGLLAGVPVRLATVHMVLKKKFPALIIERLLAPLITRYIAVSQDIKKFYVSKLFLPPDKIEVIYNAVEESNVLRRSRQDVAAGCRFPSNQALMAMIGRLDDQKGIDYLLQAVKTMVSKKINIGLLLIGDGPERKRLREAAGRLNLDQHVHFLGFQQNPMPLLAASQALVLSSLEEGLPFVVLEAMALGKPVVSTAVGAVPEAVKNGESGILIAPRDPAALAQAMETIISKPDIAKAMGEKGREILRKHFLVSVTQEQLEALYDRLFVPVP
ncbi:MAG: glycosyltransferase [Elusimicrobia bacterium]|nr:glycosyltransferase [Elusimicrobiota bacterium]